MRSLVQHEEKTSSSFLGRAQSMRDCHDSATKLWTLRPSSRLFYSPSQLPFKELSSCCWGTCLWFAMVADPELQFCWSWTNPFLLGEIVYLSQQSESLTFKRIIHTNKKELMRNNEKARNEIYQPQINNLVGVKVWRYSWCGKILDILCKKLSKLVFFMVWFHTLLQESLDTF